VTRDDDRARDLLIWSHDHLGFDREPGLPLQVAWDMKTSWSWSGS
jgi:hypothetical protein